MNKQQASQSLVPALAGVEWRRRVNYGEYHGDWYGHSSIRMVTDGGWKLAWSFGDLSELYDLESDPHELHNRFPDPEFADVREHYWQLLLQEAERTSDGQVPLAANRGGLDVELETWAQCRV